MITLLIALAMNHAEVPSVESAKTSFNDCVIAASGEKGASPSRVRKVMKGKCANEMKAFVSSLEEAHAGLPEKERRLMIENEFMINDLSLVLALGVR